jgi:hypothetical protein
MKKIVVVLMVCMMSKTALCQIDAAQQLLLNVEKLAQLKAILKNMYQGYEVVSNGYNRIKGIAQGNFSLHEVFLDGLLQVSPAVKKYKRVGDIITCQQTILREYRKGFQAFKNSGGFAPEEITYLGKVYNGLFTQSLQNLDELLLVITARQLRMNDDERLQEIDRIHKDIEDKLTFLRSFNNSTGVLTRQRLKEQKELIIERRLHGLN